MEPYFKVKYVMSSYGATGVNNSARQMYDTKFWCGYTKSAL